MIKAGEMAQRPFLFYMNSQEALNQLQNAQASVQNPATLLAQQEQQLGVGDQRNAVTGLRGAIANTTKLLEQVAPSVRGRTQNSLVTNAQAARQIANEQAPIAGDLNKYNQAYSLASQDLSDLERRAQQNAQIQYSSDQDRLSYLQNLYNNYYKREQDEATRNEQIRQFNEQIAAQNRATKAQEAYNYSLSNNNQDERIQALMKEVERLKTPLTFVSSDSNNPLKQNSQGIWTADF